MILNFVNTTTDIVVVFFNNSEKYTINPSESKVITIKSDLISFAISSSKSSQFGISKKTELIVTPKYKLKNAMQNIQLHIIKQEVEDSSLNKFIGFIIQEDYLFDKIEYLINDEASIIKTEKKNNIISHFIGFFSNIFSFINIIFIAIGIAFGIELGPKSGIICYLIVFSLYSVIFEIVEAYQDRKKSIVNFIKDEYIKRVFQSVQKSKSNFYE